MMLGGLNSEQIESRLKGPRLHLINTMFEQFSVEENHVSLGARNEPLGFPKAIINYSTNENCLNAFQKRFWEKHV